MTIALHVFWLLLHLRRTYQTVNSCLWILWNLHSAKMNHVFLCFFSMKELVPIKHRGGYYSDLCDLWLLLSLCSTNSIDSAYQLIIFFFQWIIMFSTIFLQTSNRHKNKMLSKNNDSLHNVRDKAKWTY